LREIQRREHYGEKVIMGDSDKSRKKVKLCNERFVTCAQYYMCRELSYLGQIAGNTWHLC